jgi:outer membrane protein assembly factor BamB
MSRSAPGARNPLHCAMFPVRLAVAGLLLGLIATPAAQRRASTSEAWRQWGGPNRNFIVDAPALAESWPEGGPRQIWSRPLGPGHSSILAEDGRLYTMYRVGDGRTKTGPWEAAESVIALDAASGKTIWEHNYASKIEDFNFGAGPHSTPLIVGDRLFSIGTNKQLFALDKRTGKVIWSHDLIGEFGSPSLLIRPVVKAGYGCSPIAWRDTIICSVGGPGQSVMSFRQDDGRVVWKSGDFHTADAAPVLITVGGEEQLVIVGGGSINGLNPANGAILWSYPHDPGNDLSMSMPLWHAQHGILLVSSAYKTGSRALRLTRQGGVTEPEEVWFNNRLRFMFLSYILLGDYAFGTSGDLGPSFLTAMDIRTGQMAWQHRGIARASIVFADSKAILLEEDGDLTLARFTPEGVTVLAQRPKLFDTMSWTAPTLAGTTLYARDREKIVALDLGAGAGAAGRMSPASPRIIAPPAGTQKPAAPPPPPPVNLAGTWKLETDRSKPGPSAAPAGLAKVGAPGMLHITQAANGMVLVEGQVNESQSRAYKAGRKTTTPLVPSGTITMTSRWEGALLVSEGTIDGGAAPAAVKETYSVGTDGRLTIDVTLPSGSSTLVYARTQDVGPCKSWPTPCKDFK